jgi:hypothetical protein
MFIPATFGHGSNSVSVQLLKFPPTDAPLLDKVQAFAYFDEVIQQFRSQLSSATLQQAYATTVPVSSSAAASEDSNRISQLLHDAFFSVNNLACLGFIPPTVNQSASTLIPVIARLLFDSSNSRRPSTPSLLALTSSQHRQSPSTIFCVCPRPLPLPLHRTLPLLTPAQPALPTLPTPWSSYSKP